MTRVRELDCASPPSAFTSIAQLTGIGIPELRRRMCALPFEAFEESSAASGADGATEYVWSRIVPDLPSPPIPDAVCWFHATRVPPDTTFGEGLLPLREAAARLAHTLGPATPGAAFREKIEHCGGCGPFGHLVREAAFSPIQNHFFDAPEMVVDLGYDLDAYRAATTPCIVKFRARDRREDVTPLALLYCYFSVWNQPADWDCSTTWSGEGTAVPASDIISVEFLTSRLVLPD